MCEFILSMYVSVMFPYKTLYVWGWLHELRCIAWVDMWVREWMVCVCVWDSEWHCIYTYIYIYIYICIFSNKLAMRNSSWSLKKKINKKSTGKINTFPFLVVVGYLFKNVSVRGGGGGGGGMRACVYIYCGVCVHLSHLLAFSKMCSCWILSIFNIQIQSERWQNFVWLMRHIIVKDLLDVYKWGWGPFCISLLTYRRLKGIS